MMDELVDDIGILLSENIGKQIILYDNDNRRYQGTIKKCFKEFVLIFETIQNSNKCLKYSNIKDFTILEAKK